MVLSGVNMFNKSKCLKVVPIIDLSDPQDGAMDIAGPCLADKAGNDQMTGAVAWSR